MNVKYLYLDFDGVLHPNAAVLKQTRKAGKWVELDSEWNQTHSLFMWEPILETVLCSYPEIKIILSTSWARILGFNKAKNYLTTSIKDRVFSSTWHSQMRHSYESTYDFQTRFQQILTHANANGISRNEWVAIDDNPEGWRDEYQDNLVECNPDLGLSEFSVNQKLQYVLRNTNDI